MAEKCQDELHYVGVSEFASNVIFFCWLFFDTSTNVRFYKKNVLQVGQGRGAEGVLHVGVFVVYFEEYFAYASGLRATGCCEYEFVWLWGGFESFPCIGREYPRCEATRS